MSAVETGRAAGGEPRESLPREGLSPQRLATVLGLPEPTPEQAKVIAHPLSPLLVVAGAGSGKTATMSQRVVHLVATGRVRADQVLGLTFTRKATAELAQRVGVRLDQLASSGLVETDQDGPEPTIATYNAFAGSLVRDHGLRLGVDPDSTLIAQARAWKIVSDLIEMRTAPLPVEKIGSATEAVLALDGALSENLLSVEEAFSQLSDLQELFAGLAGVRGLKTAFGGGAGVCDRHLGMLEVVQAYREHKRAHALLSFGDQIALACQIAETVPEAARMVREQFHAVLLDEFQDTSVAQVRLLSALFAQRGVTAVGDPNQAIYGWRGASAGALDTFHEHFNPEGAAAVAGGAAAQEVTPVLPLSTAWRNDLAVLAAANAVSEPLRRHVPQDGDAQVVHIPVEALRPRPEGTGLAQGAVLAAYLADPLEEAQAIADFMAERWTPQAELAVLCRARSSLDPVKDALAERGIPFEVIGVGGMLTIPEVADVRALLTVAADPERGDWLMRLLTGGGIGATDLRALYRYARKQAAGPAQVGASAVPEGEAEAESPMLAEALEAVARRADASRQGVNGVEAPGLSPDGTRLADRLARQVRRVRAALGLGLSDLVILAEQTLGLDIEIASRVGNPLGRRGLDAFRAAAEQYAVDVDAPTLAGFLDWLNLADAHEDSLASPEVAPEPGAVQLLTIHAAKGLEWDHVVVLGMNEGGFPSYRPTPKADLSLSDTSWMTKASEFPHPLRADAETLPPFRIGELEPPAVDKAEAKEMLSEYCLALGRYSVAEERRLAYVAITRARHDVLLTGSHFAKTASKPRPMSRFLAELRRRDLLTPYGPGFTDLDPEAGNPLVGRSVTASWPQDPTVLVTPVSAARQGAAQAVSALEEVDREGVLSTDNASSGDPLVQRWQDEARLLLAERDRVRSEPVRVRLPQHLAATSLDTLRTQPERFALDLRRPLPPQPRAAGRLGTVFHDAVAQRLSRHGALFSLAEAGVPDSVAAQDRERLERWLATAENLPLLRGYTLEEAEVERELTVSGTTLRCRIDAVFRREGAAPDAEGAWLIVDWKTGRFHVPVDQLSAYVHAWSSSLGVGTSAVRAAYVYVDAPGGEVDELAPEQLLTLESIEQVLSPADEGPGAR